LLKLLNIFIIFFIPNNSLHSPLYSLLNGIFYSFYIPITEPSLFPHPDPPAFPYQPTPISSSNKKYPLLSGMELCYHQLATHNSAGDEVLWKILELTIIFKAIVPHRAPKFMSQHRHGLADLMLSSGFYRDQGILQKRKWRETMGMEDAKPQYCGKQPREKMKAVFRKFGKQMRDSPFIPDYQSYRILFADAKSVLVKPMSASQTLSVLIISTSPDVVHPVVISQVDNLSPAVLHGSHVTHTYITLATSVLKDFQGILTSKTRNPKQGPF
ncbi:hypothetical protein STEG23_035717, partial [Scotinomys teguina]